MYKCKKCGQLKAFFQLNNDGLCKSCAQEKAAEKASKPMPNRTYNVVGIDHYKEAIDRVFTVNPESQLKPKEFMSKYPVGSQVPIYKVKESLPAHLVKDPQNPYDKNAIQVLVNGELIGYIDRDTAAKFNTPLELATSITAKIKSSTYKTVTESMKGKMYVATYGCLAITVTVSFK